MRTAQEILPEETIKSVLQKNGCVTPEGLALFDEILTLFNIVGVPAGAETCRALMSIVELQTMFLLEREKELNNVGRQSRHTH